ncbi:MAG: hypothetical protein ACE5MM_08320, partial [Nitrospiraceae bacterium]
VIWGGRHHLSDILAARSSERPESSPAVRSSRRIRLYGETLVWPYVRWHQPGSDFAQGPALKVAA